MQPCPVTESVYNCLKLTSSSSTSSSSSLLLLLGLLSLLIRDYFYFTRPVENQESPILSFLLIYDITLIRLSWMYLQIKTFCTSGPNVWSNLATTSSIIHHIRTVSQWTILSSLRGINRWYWLSKPLIAPYTFSHLLTYAVFSILQYAGWANKTAHASK